MTRIFLNQFLALVSLIVSARIAFTLPFSPIPFTAQTISVLSIPFFMHANQAVFPLLIYLLLSLIGLPLLAEGRGGLDVFMGPSIGFLLGFVIATFNQMYWANKVENEFFSLFTLNLMGHLIILICGGVGLFFLGKKFEFLIFLPMAILKSILISALVLTVHKITGA